VVGYYALFSKAANGGRRMGETRRGQTTDRKQAEGGEELKSREEEAAEKGRRRARNEVICDREDQADTALSWTCNKPGT
jgi:hypothetical protein